MGTLWGWGWGVKRSYQKWVGEDNSLLGGLEMLKVRRGRVLGEPERPLLFGSGTSSLDRGPPLGSGGSPLVDLGVPSQGQGLPLGIGGLLPGMGGRWRLWTYSYKLSPADNPYPSNRHAKGPSLSQAQGIPV